MGLWDKVKDAAQKAADAAKDQVQREGSILNKTMDATKKAADKAAVVARDQVNRQDSALNKAKASVAKGSDSMLGSIDAMDSNNRNDEIATAKKYAARRRSESQGGYEPAPEPEGDEGLVRFPNSADFTDDEVYKQVSDTIYPEFRTLPATEKKWAICEIARFDKKIVDRMRAIGSAWIDTFRELAEGDDGYHTAFEAAGLSSDRELQQAYRNWLDDSYDDEFYADDDGGHVKAVRLLGWLVFSRVGGSPGEDGGALLARTFADSGVRDVHGIAKHLAKARELVDAREAVIERVFRARRASFASQFLVQKGLNADVHFAWLEKDGSTSDAEPEDEPGNDDGGESPFEI